MYIIDLNKLLPGDIIFYRNPDDKLSLAVMKATNSDYSHVMLYVGNTMYIHATTGRVVSSNLQRFLFSHKDDVLVKRLSEDDTHPVIIDVACSFARLVVGTEYDDAIVYPIVRGKNYTPADNRQTCSRLVAEAYSKTGLPIVDNVEKCVPQDLLQSDYLEEVLNCVRLATKDEEDFAKTEDVNVYSNKVLHTMLDNLKKYSNGEIQRLEQLVSYVLAHPGQDMEITNIVKESGYFSILDKEKELNPYNYNMSLFAAKYRNDTPYAAIATIIINEQNKQFYIQQLRDLQQLHNSAKHPSPLICNMLQLYRGIIAQHEARICVANQVLQVIESGSPLPIVN